MTNPDAPLDMDVDFGPLTGDVLFVVRTLQSLLRPEGQAIRADLQVEPGMIGVLAIVWLNPGISQNDLATSVVLKKSAVTALVKDLEVRGLLSRRRLSKDRRMNALSLTSEGQALILRMRHLTEQANDRLFNGIAPADRETFFNVAQRLVENLSTES